MNGLITCEMLVNVFSIVSDKFFKYFIRLTKSAIIQILTIFTQSDNMLMFVLFDMLHRFIWKRHFINALLVLKISMCSFTETSCVSFAYTN